MHYRVLTVLALACAMTAFSLSSTKAAGKACAPFSFGGYSYTICSAPLNRFSIKLLWRRPDGKPYNYLSALPARNAQGESISFAFNGGMYDPDYKPVGLYVENGEQFVAANTRPGAGNFHLKPNGIFYVKGREAGVMETAAFLRKKLRPDFATQSGPMLVVDGELNRRIAGAAISKKRRDGVCVQDGRVVFAISEAGTPFGAFARLFRDGLKCRNALFLDGGSAPALFFPAGAMTGNTFVALGPMIAAYEKPWRFSPASLKLFNLKVNVHEEVGR